jgi:hypothetical protein
LILQSFLQKSLALSGSSWLLFEPMQAVQSMFPMLFRSTDALAKAGKK